MQPHNFGRANSYHNTKRQLLGSQAGRPAPAWRTNQETMRNKAATEQGSKILLSRLPADVSDEEVEALFAKTVGPVKEAFIVYNSQGRSKGMAVVVFQRSSDAGMARMKYNGKIIDGRRPIKIEIIKDEDTSSQEPQKPRVPSLLERLGNVPAQPFHPIPVPTSLQPHQQAPVKTAQPRPYPVGGRRRTKKGPKRVKKSREQLDKEMEDYRARLDGPLDPKGNDQ